VIAFHKPERTIMRILTAAALAATLSFGLPALAVAQATNSQTDNAPAAAKPGAISKIQVIDVKQLPATVQAQVDEVVSKSSDDDMKALRASIDGSPAASSALKEKGLTSAQVVAINIADGVLTMFAKVA
jgi:hypothetical protein